MVSLVAQSPSGLPAQNPKPTKPLLRRSTLSGTIRKREDAGLDSDILSAPCSPVKRPRVTFNPDVEEKVMEEYSPKLRSLESVRGEVKRAIDAHGRGDSEGYDIIKDIFAPRKEDDEREDQGDIRQYLLALSSNAALLNRGCSGLVGAMLACEWMGRDEGFVKAYVQFLGSLASAQGLYVGSVLGMLVGNFSGVRMSSGRLRGYPTVNREQLTSRIHVALKYLLRLIPSASSTLSPIISSKFPSSDDPKKVHVVYIENLTRLTEYAPELKSDIFALITDRLVKIDVQMQVDLDDLDDGVGAAIVQALTLQPTREVDLDGEDSDSDADSVTSDESLDNDSKRIREVQGNVEKMDAILDLLFTIYDPYFSDPHSLEAASMFETLLGHFTHIILPTYHSRHAQFLLFHFAQKAEHLVDQFAGTCVQLAFQSGRPAILRQSSSSYLASFVARGAHVPAHVVRTVFELIGSHLDHIRAENEPTCRGPDLQRYSTFYAMTQALLYIFCFRWRDLLASDEVLDENDDSFPAGDLNWTPGIKDTLSRTIYSKLNPLKICSPPIVSEFAKIARHLRFMYVYSLLETNKRIRLSQFASGRSNGALRDTGNGGNSESWHQLDGYFPFDPYQLPVSRRWVDPDYVQWKGIPGLDGKEDDDESGDEDEDEDVEVEEDTATDEDGDE
ncbi:RNA polymerase I-specific transcription initiation factor rrn3 [Hyphodiscus hymeniophilus]|uniref:RNA polymerase I-specific transcription initiation factor rrn3 n=1 Tax=Hyphodiscus hymeniophilus TaxID=353542 RepID=A0A9P6VMP7_9HELO|nr:RNA polymerase I-specific transcription initiation factor rrn3 [Hyphodiscus hymeniophilus]